MIISMCRFLLHKTSQNTAIANSRRANFGLGRFLAANKKRLSIGIWFSVLILGIFYVVQINATATKGFEIKNLEKQVEALKEEQRKMEVSVVEKSSLSAIQPRIGKMGMVKVANMEYLNSEDVAMAAQ